MRRRFSSINTSQDIGLTKNYFTIEALDNGLEVVLSNNACEYCVDGGIWSILPANTYTISIDKGHQLSFRAKAIPLPNVGIGTFTISKKCNLKGNIMSLIFGGDFVDKTDLMGMGHIFFRLFFKCVTIVDASELILPGTTLTDRCYFEMFYGCTRLTASPKLPATILAS